MKMEELKKLDIEEIENKIKFWGEYGIAPYCIVTSPCYDDNLRNNILGPQEAVFNITKFPNECNAVLKSRNLAFLFFFVIIYIPFIYL